MFVHFRQSDGRKVLRSSIREFLCSEAMFALGIPTTRAGSLVTSDLYVQRDVFYSGNPRPERCSVVLRIAPTFIRFKHIYLCLSSDAHFKGQLTLHRQTQSNGNRQFIGFCWIGVTPWHLLPLVGASFCQMNMFSQRLSSCEMSEN